MCTNQLIKHSRGMNNLSEILKDTPSKSPFKSPGGHRIYDTVENLAVAVEQEPQYDKITKPAFGKAIKS